MANLMIHIYYEDYFKSISLGAEAKSEIKIGSDNTNDVILYSRLVERCSFILSRNDSKWFIEDPNRSSIVFNGRNIEKRELIVGDVYEIAPVEHKGERMQVVVCDASQYKSAMVQYDITNEKRLVVGSIDNADLRYMVGPMDASAFVIEQNEGSYTIRELASKKYKINQCSRCVYVNDRRIRGDYQLSAMDTIHINGHTIQFYQATSKKEVDGYEIIHQEAYLSVEHLDSKQFCTDLEVYEEAYTAADDVYLFEIQSRLYSPMPEEKVVIEQPNPMPSKPKINWLSILLPPVLMAFVFMFIMPLLRNSMGGSYGIMIVFFSGITVVTSTVNYFTQKSKHKKDLKKRTVDYEKMLERIRTDLNNKREEEILSLTNNHMSFESCVDVVSQMKRRLWERSYVHEDFLEVKIGKGRRKSVVTIDAPTIKAIDANPDPLVVKANELKDTFQEIPDSPITLDLLHKPVVSILGDRTGTNHAIRTMVSQLTTNHSYQEVKCVFLYNTVEKDAYEWARWLPHVWDVSKQFRYMASTKEDARLLLDSITDVLKQRISDESESNLKVRSLPHYVFFIMDRDLIHNHPIVNYLIMPKEELGLTSIFALADSKWVPQHCHYEIKIDPYKGELITDGIRKNVQLFMTEDISGKHMDEFARKMAPIKIRDMASSAGIPSKVSLFDVLGINKLEELNIETLWKKGKAYKSMATPIGKRLGGELFYFDIHEKEHGPHGLVAGTTGSGKSETMLSYLASLCTHYHPNQVGFVIIDYKGGGMANEIEALPHLLGTITNLDENQIQRALLSLKSELKKRQRLFDQYKVNHIDAYIQLNIEGVAEEPLPHLLLIVDEFAELKADQPDFMKELISTARIGRSLGIHLILATQKPSGVVNDQIWSNSRFKLCLKVSTATDSKEVIKRSDAAYITLPGRAYIQIGNDEVFELFQSAYGGVLYEPDKKETCEELNVFAVDVVGRKKQIYPRISRQYEEKKGRTQMQALSQFIRESAKKQGISQLEGPWKPDLLAKYYLPEHDSQLQKDGHVRMLIGVYDQPDYQAQGALYFDLDVAGSTLIYGRAATGKTTLLMTMIMNCIKHYSVEEMQLYIADFGSRILGVFSEAPHVGGVIYSEELDRFERLLAYIRQLLDTRKKLFTKVGVTNIGAYNSIDGHCLSTVITVIDNMTFLKEYKEKDYSEIISSLIREGMNYGLYFIGTSASHQGVGHKITNVMPGVIAFSLKDKAEYAMVLGGTTKILPRDMQGRAITKKQGQIVEVQCMLPEFGEKEHEMTQNIRKAISEMDHTSKNKVYQIPALPDRISLSKALENCPKETIPMGMELSDLENVSIKLGDFGGFFVTGLKKRGVTNAIRVMMHGISTTATDSTDRFVFDNFDGELSALNQVTNYLSDYGEVDSFLKKIDTSIENPDKRTVICIKDISYFMRMTNDGVKNKIATYIGGALYQKTNVIIGMKDNSVGGFDAFSKAIKSIDSGLVLGHSEAGLNALGIKVAYGTRKQPLKKGQGYMQTIKDTWKIQVSYDDITGGSQDE